MAYSSEIAKILTDQIAKFATLNRHQLVGHVANLDFWTAEVRHGLDVLDGYKARFERLKAAQARYVSEHGTVEFLLDDPCCTRGVCLHRGESRIPSLRRPGAASPTPCIASYCGASTRISSTKFGYVRSATALESASR
jgi:hypothetical protein